MQLIESHGVDNLYGDDESDLRDSGSRSLTKGHSDRETLEIFGCWKQQLADRYGAGSHAPSVPESQRAYDGDNWFEFCEPWVG